MYHYLWTNYVNFYYMDNFAVLLKAGLRNQAHSLNKLLSLGKALINGIDVTQKPPKAQKQAAYLSENVILYGNLTVRQNLDFFVKISGKTNLSKANYYNLLRKAGLRDRALEKLYLEYIGQQSHTI